MDPELPAPIPPTTVERPAGSGLPPCRVAVGRTSPFQTLVVMEPLHSVHIGMLRDDARSPCSSLLETIEASTTPPTTSPTAPSLVLFSRSASSRIGSSYPGPSNRPSRSLSPSLSRKRHGGPVSLDSLPNEVLLHILGFLDVNDLLTTSRTNHHMRCLCVAPILHILRRRYIRAVLPPLLASPSRPSLADLMARSIFLTNTTVKSRKLGRDFVAIRLKNRLAKRPPVHVLVERCVLPQECAPGIGHVAPALAARTRAIEREKLKDGLRNWVGGVWKREVGRRSERVRKVDESVGIGRVWRMRKFWERVGRGDG